MSQTHRTPTPHYTPSKHYSTLTIAIFPLAIYFLQLLGKASALAACAAGILVVLKVIVELQHHHRASVRRPSPPPTLVRVQAPLAGCYLCGELHHLRPYQMEGQRVGICRHCHHCMAFSGRYA